MTTLPQERVRSHRWEGKGVELRTVVDELRRLHAELAYEETGDRDHPHPRNCVMNLVISVSDERRAEAVAKVVKGVSAGHPLRAIVLYRLEDAQGDGLDAEITTEAHELVRGASVQREQVTLRVRGSTGTHVASLVEPLLVSDVPTYLWWTGTPPLAERGLRDTLTVADVLIVDSAHFDTPVASFMDLAALADRLGDRISFVDLQWARQRAWREILAQFFSPEERREFLVGMRRLTVEGVGSGQRSRIGAALLVGWLAGALGLRFRVGVSVSEASADALLEGPQGQMVQATFRSTTAEGLDEGVLLAVQFDGKTQDKRFAMRVEINRERPDHAHAHVDIGGVETLSQRLPLPQPTEAELLLHALSTARRDRVYVRSLEAAAALVDALR